ncbi:MAG: hypothetical protein OQK24_01775 [Magnetovibrio sp.]|nr:hypothetical protein [Magnetovibrio sp.]
MADGSKPPKKLEKEEALKLAHQGNETWNAWAEEHPGWEVDFSGYDFSGKEQVLFGCHFPGLVRFTGCTFNAIPFKHDCFSGGVDFSSASFDGEDLAFHYIEFRGKVNFMEASFSGGVYFYRCQFEGAAYFPMCHFQRGGCFFSDVEFKGGIANFRASHFDEPLWFSRTSFSHGADFSRITSDDSIYLESCEFSRVPDFRYSGFKRHFPLSGMRIDYAVSSDIVDFAGVRFDKAKTHEDADKFRRLKELAIQAKDHEKEQDFFAKELMAKRFYETKGLALVWSYLYEWFSDFGRSTWRPLSALLGTWFIFGLCYWWSAQWSAVGPLKSVGDGMKMSASVLVPFVATARTSYAEAKLALFGKTTGFLLDFFVIFEGILGLAFAFLIGLALRNRFRI